MVKTKYKLLLNRIRLQRFRYIHIFRRVIFRYSQCIRDYWWTVYTKASFIVEKDVRVDSLSRVKGRTEEQIFRKVIVPLKSTSPFPSVSKMSMTRWTRGFCCSSGRDMNSSMDSEPELSRSSFLNRFPRRLISSASNVEHISIGSDVSFPFNATSNIILIYRIDQSQNDAS